MSDRKRERARKHFAEAIEKAAQAKENPDKENSSAPMVSAITNDLRE